MEELTLSELTKTLLEYVLTCGGADTVRADMTLLEHVLTYGGADTVRANYDTVRMCADLWRS